MLSLSNNRTVTTYRHQAHCFDVQIIGIACTSSRTK
uniref:Uncharacterized protein n=1 Tax=Siphoviridae sp. ctK0l2 TaxID=2826243 RepID=A0A8S5NKP3_9CAUD|nr:MAG TPA: hypothetical protein [Siphoviridae sp. ctK0l2]